MDETIEIAVDVREVPSGIPARLIELGTNVELEALPVGDYIVGASIVERKRVDDFHSSIASGKLWAQVGALRESTLYPFLLVEGDDLDDGPIAPTAIRAICIQALRFGVRLLRTRDAPDSALWIHRLAVDERRRHRYRPRRAQPPKPNRARDPATAMLAAIPGISTTTAQTLLRRYGSVVGVLSASFDDLCSVPGIGPKRAATICDASTAQCSQSFAATRTTGSRHMIRASSRLSV